MAPCRGKGRTGIKPIELRLAATGCGKPARPRMGSLLTVESRRPASSPHGTSLSQAPNRHQTDWAMSCCDRMRETGKTADGILADRSAGRNIDQNQGDLAGHGTLLRHTAVPKRRNPSISPIFSPAPIISGRIRIGKGCESCQSLRRGTTDLQGLSARQTGDGGR